MKKLRLLGKGSHARYSKGEEVEPEHQNKNLLVWIGFTTGQLI